MGRKLKKHRRYRKVTDEQCIKALEITGGRIYHAAQRLGITSPNLVLRTKSSKAVYDALCEIRGRCLDFAEDQLMERIREGDLKAIIFYLKTIGRERGYDDRPIVNQTFNHTVQHNQMIQNEINMDLSALSIDELKVLAKAIGIDFKEGKDICLPQH